MGRSSHSEEYVLRGGCAGAERLRVLNRVKWPTTEPLLRVAGLGAGMSCLDVGCGSGDVTLEMALEAGLEEVRVGLLVPTFREDEGKRVTQITMEHIREAVVGVGLASDAEVDNIVGELGRLADDDRTLMSMAPTFQVWGLKAGA